MDSLLAKRKELEIRINELREFAILFRNGKLTNLQFISRTEDLSDIKNELNEINRDIIHELKDEESYLNEHSEIAKNLRLIIYEIKDALLTISTTQPEIRIEASQTINLPKFELPTFSGDIAQWKQFADQFLGAINQGNISGSHKFRYLLSALKGEPYKLLQHLEATDACFPIAWKILDDRYNNTRLIIEQHINAILDIPPITGTASLEKLKRFFDCVNEHIQALDVLKQNTSGFIWFTIVVRKLDRSTRHAWELTTRRDKLPTLDGLLKFISREINALQTMQHDEPKSTYNDNSRRPQLKHQSNNFFTQSKTAACLLCNSQHTLYQCSQFISLTIAKRRQLANEKNLCYNCLSSVHKIQNCQSKRSCRYCNKRHHSLLHPQEHLEKVDPQFSTPLQTTSKEETTSKPVSFNAVATCTSTSSKNLVLLATAIIDVHTQDGHPMPIRALLDSASQTSYITESCVQRLQLSRKHTDVSIVTLGQVSLHAAKGMVLCNIRPHGKTYPSYATSAIVVPRISGSMPSTQVESDLIRQWSYLPLADPDFATPSKIDMLLGADLYPYVLTGNKVTSNTNSLIAQETTFGWILSGFIQQQQVSLCNTFLLENNQPLEKMMTRFWEVEEIHTKPTPLSPDDVLCEKIYTETVTRDETGRYAVSLPFRKDRSELGNSHHIAVKCFLSLERRLANTPNLRQDYINFMREYLDAGHMEQIKRNDLPSESCYYIPHHCVLKPDSSTTKLRVVFNASKRTTLNTSLNDVLLTGPPLQQDLTAILLRFRFFRYVITADIKQMYRQILVQPHHRRYQRIIWRFDPNEPLQEYDLKTVTYGVSSAPYLAIRTLQQLSNDEQHRYPLASPALLQGAYVDDILFGSNSLDETICLQKELTQLLAAGGFELRKWASNHANVLADIPQDYQQFTERSLDLESSPVMKILGLYWNPIEDKFSYRINPLDRTCTKRVILSEIARIFDPLGLFAPIIMFAKVLLQRLWTLTIGWDDCPPDEIIQDWTRFQEQLPLLDAVRIPRHIPSEKPIFLIGFCDASNLGYAAVLYVRESCETNSQPHLLCAKSRVAPLKRISIPRLELCAALLLARLIKSVTQSLSNKIHSVLAFSDSTIALSWISTQPHLLKVFESNRVTEIQDIILPSQWHHVASRENPADCASRGLLPDELHAHDLWWNGPTWLQRPPDTWVKNNEHLQTTSLQVEEEDTAITLLTCNPEPSFIEKMSSFSKLQRVTAYIFRFINRCRRMNTIPSQMLTPLELHQATIWLIKQVQQSEFALEINKINNNQPCIRQIQKLNPFIDSEGLLRVGGRLKHSTLPYQQKHPILIPQHHHMTSLLIDYHHKVNCHVGFGTLLSILSKQYWILSAKRAIQRRLTRCMTCFRQNPKSYVPKMGDLPKYRVQQVKPFQSVGTDFGGPFKISFTRARGSRTTKAYLCLFVCMTTKALHLELASELSTDAFLAAFRRFIARRGKCTDIYSDCGTNFVGANKYLTEIQDFLKSTANQQAIANSAASDCIKWHFNPPSAPHFGGIWEAGIKSVKRLLYKVIGDQVFSYEEFYTILTQIEAVLNSRPLCPLSNDPNDLSVLTPGHFLIGEELVSPPEHDLAHVPINRLTRWQLLQQLQQSFWKRWHAEYLNTLQQRSKWLHNPPALSAGTLVLIKDNLCPPTRWKLGRILDLITGKDGIARVATVKTQSGELLRPLVKLCPLPIHS